MDKHEIMVVCNNRKLDTPSWPEGVKCKSLPVGTFRVVSLARAYIFFNSCLISS